MSNKGCTARDISNAIRKALNESTQADEHSLRRFVKILVQNADLNTWVYLGLSNDYVIIPGAYCSCNDFTIRVVGRREKCYCKHLIEQALSERRGLYKVINLDSLGEYIKILNEVLTQNLTSTLRKKIYSR
ncbi:metal-binding protein [Thermogladius sp. 4427co]|uniref:metal-binding protein n=1 Tax=Thermogladius sp. 4427co TaxID=3450718 RepID=UPI003F792EF7